jgi:hypothetical protein
MFSYFTKEVQPRLPSPYAGTDHAGTAAETTTLNAGQNATPDQQAASFDELAPWLLLVLGMRS